MNFSWFLNPWRFFNSYEEQNNHVGKAKPEIGLVIQELIGNWKISLISGWGYQGKIAAARSGWDIRHFYLNYHCEGLEKQSRSISNIYTVQILPHSVIFLNACIVHISIFNIESSIKSRAPLAMRVLYHSEF